MDKEAQYRASERRTIAKLGIFVMAGIIIGTIALVGGVYLLTSRNTATITPRESTQQDGNLVSTSDESVITSVVDKVSPSIVSVMTNVSTRTPFGVARQQAAGTGIIVSKDGHVLTNKHVVSEATALEVILSDGTSYGDVTIVGEDPLNDIAFLKIRGVSDLTPASLGDSSTIRVGQGVIAIGNALGQYQNTVSSGIVSGKGRPIDASDGSGQSSESLTDLIQTDAAINPGNSGGPLLNRSGQVIGVNTAVAADAEGIGFAIPINATKGMLKSVLAGKDAKRAHLGLRYIAITAAIAKEYNLPTKQGAYVIGSRGASGVQSDSPAKRAGMQDKDIITKINSLEVGPRGGVLSLIGEYAPGDTVDLTVLRGGKELTLKVTLAAYQP